MLTVTQETLKSCPFCGATDLSFETLADEEETIEETSIVQCNKCGASGGYYFGNDSTSPDDAAGFWNTRTPAPVTDGAKRKALAEFSQIADSDEALLDENGDTLLSKEAVKTIRAALEVS